MFPHDVPFSNYMSFMEKARPMYNASQWPSGLRYYVTSDGVEIQLGFVVQIRD